MPRLLPSTKPWILIRRIRCASFIALQFYSQWINIRYGAVLRRLLILGRGRQLVQDLISSSKRKVRECIVCEATVLLSTSSQVYTIIGISYKWGLYDKNHVTSFVLRCAIFAKKTLPVMLTAVAFFPAKIGQFRARLIYHNWMYGTGKFYTRSRISMSQMCFKTAALIR